MNTDTGEVRRLTPQEIEAMSPAERKLWTPILEDEHEDLKRHGAESVKSRTPDQHLSRSEFRRKWGCSRLEYGLRRVK